MRYSGFFSFFGKVGAKKFFGKVRGQKMAQDDNKIMSVALHISGTIYHMIAIYRTLV